MKRSNFVRSDELELSWKIFTPVLHELEEKKIKATFGDTNIMALIVPSGHYDKEKAVLEELETYDEVDYTTGLSNIEVSMDDDSSSEKSDSYMLTDSLTPRQFAELADMDIEQARIIYSAYAVDNEEYGHIINNLDGYGVPLIDMFLFAYDHLDYVNLDQDQVDKLDDLHDQLIKGQDQLQSDKYTRMLISLNLPEENDETFEFLSTIRKVAQKHYGEDAQGETGKNVMNPQTIVYLEEGASIQMDTVQIRGIDSTKRYTKIVCGKDAEGVVTERLLTHGHQEATSDMEIVLDGENSRGRVISRSVAQDESSQLFYPRMVGNAKCFGHVQCDSIIMGSAKIRSIPEIAANSTDAQLIHEAAIGKIAGDQLLKLQTLGLTAEEAEDTILKGFLA